MRRNSRRLTITLLYFFDLFRCMSAISGRSPFTDHRLLVTAADKVVPPTIQVAKNDNVTGSLTAVEHGVTVAVRNKYGSAGISNIVVLTPTVNKCVTITVPAVSGATNADVFISTSTTEPLWVASVSLATVAATGVTVTGVGATSAGGGAGKIIVKDVGTGQKCTNTNFAVNNAYRPELVAEPILFRGPVTLEAFIDVTVDDLRVAPELVIVPCKSKNEYEPTEWYVGEPVTIELMTKSGSAMSKPYTLTLAGTGYVMLLIDKVVGQGKKVTIATQVVDAV